MANDVTFGDLLRQGAIIKGDIAAAVDAYMTDPEQELFVIGDGYVIELAAAVRASAYAGGLLADLEIDVHWRRSVVRSAILLSRPVKG